MDAVTEDEYDAEVQSVVDTLVSMAEDSDEPSRVIWEEASTEVNHHNWFARTYYDGSLYGSVVEHADVDTARYTDWQALIESDSPEKTLKRLAAVVMEAEIIKRGLDRVSE